MQNKAVGRHRWYRKLLVSFACCRRWYCCTVLALAALLGGCGNLTHKTTIYQDGKRLQVSVLENQSWPKANLLVEWKPSPLDIETSLRQLTVRRSKLVIFVLQDAAPLLSNEQIKQLTPILVAQLPKLKERQRLRVTFNDHASIQYYQVDIYAVPPELVYRFHQFAVNRLLDKSDGSSSSEVRRAKLVAQPGQRIENTRAWIEIRDTVFQAGSQAAQDKVQRIETNLVLLEQQELSQPIKDELRTWAQQQQQLASKNWQLYLSKRSTLERALQHGLLNKDEYQQRLQTLDKSIGR